MMPNSDLKVLGEKVRKERKLAGLTQEQLAETNPKANQFYTNSVDSQADLNLCFQIICQCRI